MSKPRHSLFGCLLHPPSIGDDHIQVASCSVFVIVCVLRITRVSYASRSDDDELTKLRLRASPARFRLVNGEDALDGAERGLALVLPKTCDNEEHHPVRQVPVGTAQFELVRA